MGHINGSLKVEVNGEEYTLFMGMSNLADLQEKHGQDVINKLEAPEGASGSWVPDLGIVCDIFIGALQRFHGDEEDLRWLADDIYSSNPDILMQLLEAAFPPPKEGARGKTKKAAKRA